MAELTPQGVVTKSYAEWLEKLKADHAAIDPDWDVRPETLDGQKIATDALTWSSLDQFAVASYQSVDIDSANDEALDRIGRTITGEARNEGTYSTVQLQFSGVQGSNIGSGFTVQSAVTGSRWVTTSAGSVGAGGTVDISAQAVEVGAIEAAAGDISILVNVASGITGVTNTSSASTGEARESNAQYRYKIKKSVGKVGSNQVDSIYAQCFGVPEVKDVLVEENYESTVDANGVEGHSLAIFVDGGDNNLIAEAVASVKNPGCGMNRDNVAIPNKVTLDTTTPAGRPANVTFFRPELKNCFVKVSVTFYGQEPVGAVDQIKKNIILYAEGEPNFGSAQGFDISGFKIGETVYAGKLSTPVNQIIADNGFSECPSVGSTSAAADNSFDPGFNGLAVFTEENIEVVVTII